MLAVCVSGLARSRVGRSSRLTTRLYWRLGASRNVRCVRREPLGDAKRTAVQALAEAAARKGVANCTASVGTGPDEPLRVVSRRLRDAAQIANGRGSWWPRLHCRLLTSGILAHGFARVRCSGCGAATTSPTNSFCTHASGKGTLRVRAALCRRNQGSAARTFLTRPTNAVVSTDKPASSLITKPPPGPGRGPRPATGQPRPVSLRLLPAASRSG